MSPKKAIIILLIIALVVAIVFIFLYYQQKQKDTANMAKPAYNIEELVNKKNQGIELLAEEEEYLNKIISDKVSKRAEELKQKDKEEIKSSGYTEEELKFIANPEKTIKEELGIEIEPKKVKFYTQEELDNIANPK